MSTSRLGRYSSSLWPLIIVRRLQPLLACLCLYCDHVIPKIPYPRRRVLLAMQQVQGLPGNAAVQYKMQTTATASPRKGSLLRLSVASSISCKLALFSSIFSWSVLHPFLRKPRTSSNICTWFEHEQKTHKIMRILGWIGHMVT